MVAKAASAETERDPQSLAGIAYHESGADYKTPWSQFGLSLETSRDTAADHADFDLAVGRLHLVNLASFTGGSASLPTTAKLGEMCGIMVTVTGTAIDLLSGATADDINGTDHSVTPWTSLDTAFAPIIFRCVSAAAPDWAVVHDERPMATESLATVAQVVDTANVQLVAGNFYNLAASGLTAARLLQLPDGTDILDKRIGLYVESIDSDFHMALATLSEFSTINGASDVGNGSPIWRLVHINEVIVLRCVKAGGSSDTDWIIEHDGLDPITAQIELTTAFSNPGTSSWQAPTVGNGAWTKNGDLANVMTTADGYFNLKRLGTYTFRAQSEPNTSVSAGGIGLRIKDDNGDVHASADKPGTGGNDMLSCASTFLITDPSLKVRLEVWSDQANVGAAIYGGTTGRGTKFEILEHRR